VYTYFQHQISIDKKKIARTEFLSPDKNSISKGAKAGITSMFSSYKIFMIFMGGGEEQ
jgi:hypothetical protein